MVELDDENRIRMHDHLRDLGKEIATTHSPHRLWLPQQITNIKREPKKVVEIRGIIAETTEFHEDFTVPCWFTALCWSNFHTPFEECIEFVRSYCRKFRRFTPPYLRLELLVVRDHYFAEEFATQARDLVWLRWVDFQQRTLPSWLSLKNLRVLELCKAMKLKELWRDDADPALELRELLITGAHSFLSFPRSIGCLKHLKKISLGDLVEECPMGGLPKEFCLLQSLEHLQLQWCTSITSLPTRFGDLTNMRHLDLSFCGELRMLPLSFKELIHLEYIDLKNCYKLTFTSDILENMTKLEILNISQCRELEVFPRITNQGSLRKLYVKGMDSLREFPSNIGQLSQLQVLEIGSELLTSLPSSIGNLSSLRSLQIRQCRKLKSLPESIGGLHLLEHLHIGSKLLTSLPISLGNLSSLTNLQIRQCEKLESLPESIGGLHLLEHLGIATAGVKSLPKALEQLSNLRELYISNCPIRELTLGSGFISSSLHNLKFIDLRKTHVSRISISQQCCPCLETLTLLSNEHLIDIERLSISLKTISLSNCKMLKSINGICDLVNLQRLEIRGCENLDELPCFAELVSLKDFTISDDTEKHKQIKGLERCSSLETLSVRTMWKGAGIQSLKHMKRLRTLEISASCNILAIEPSLHTIEKWPSQTIIFARTDSDEYSTVKSFAFHNLTIVDSFLRRKAGRHILKSGHRHSSNAAAMACFVITSFCEAIEVYSAREDGGYPSHTLTVEKGKWVWISVFTDASSLMGIDIRPNTADHVEVWGTLVIGEQEKVVEGFHKLLLHLGKSNSV